MYAHTYFTNSGHIIDLATDSYFEADLFSIDTINVFLLVNKIW